MKSNEIKEKVKTEVKESWRRLCLYTELFGANDELTEIERYKWSALDTLWRKLYPREEY